MVRSDPMLPEVYVHPGESHLVERPSVMRTILGSCVGIVWHLPGHGLGALCHPMLPAAPAGEIPPSKGRRYVDFSIREMAACIDTLGIPRAQLRVKLFGGADVLDVVSGSSQPTVGRLNAEAAARVLEQEGIPVAASRLGGTHGVHLSFSTGTGEVIVRRLPQTGKAYPLPWSIA